jgi:superoxide reductase
MAALHEVYKCSICGNIVEVVHGGKGQLVCCNQPMVLEEENTVDASKEKHVPVVTEKEGQIFISVGSVPHPMDEKHYIEWIEVIDGAKTQKIFLKPGEEPKADFAAGGGAVRAYCNLHGLWKA